MFDGPGQLAVRAVDALYVISEILAVVPYEAKQRRGTVCIKHDTYNQVDDLVMSVIGVVLTPARL
jgi:acyl dehydratase